MPLFKINFVSKSNQQFYIYVIAVISGILIVLKNMFRREKNLMNCKK